MNKAPYIYTLYSLALAGTLFSGYLSGVKLFTNTCAFGEGCPLFLGYPACYFGFILFFTLLVTITLAVFKKVVYIKAARTMSLVSLLGILFAGYYVIGELATFAKTGFQAGTLVLPTCAYGLIFYMLVFVVAVRFRKFESRVARVESTDNQNSQTRITQS